MLEHLYDANKSKFQYVDIDIAVLACLEIEDLEVDEEVFKKWFTRRFPQIKFGKTWIAEIFRSFNRMLASIQIKFQLHKTMTQRTDISKNAENPVIEQLVVEIDALKQQVAQLKKMKTEKE